MIGDPKVWGAIRLMSMGGTSKGTREKGGKKKEGKKGMIGPNFGLREVWGTVRKTSFKGRGNSVTRQGGPPTQLKGMRNERRGKKPRIPD